ncbi:RNA-binding protein 25 isoform X3 [Salvia hispanica]|uniref:RNA-binding protein 25 isoform X3 n=1 Tax=Salvia hispanica TaxID=49212 RepID=UPI002009D141|nr:RNA-binding protein 25 isoform X3 [Salvia hispanica]
MADSSSTPSAGHNPEPESRPAQPDPSSISLPNPTPAPTGPLMQPSFRPAGPGTLFSLPTGAPAPQFSHVPYQAPAVPPPGVVPPPYVIAGQPMRYGPPMSNGYSAMPPGVPHYPSPYAQMLRPAFPPRPLVGVMPSLARPPVIGIRGPIVPPVVRPITPNATSSEDPQTTVYVGKISSTVENDFMLSLLQLCGPVKNWKRPQDPTGTLKGFGFCEFESAEGVLRALRLLNKLRVDGQELLLNVNQTTRKYLERYVDKKIEGSKAKETATDGSDKEEERESSIDTEKVVKSTEESLKPSSDEPKKDNSEINKDNLDAGSFGLVTDADRDADRDASEKLTGMIEERLKNKPLPPPPPPPQTLIDGPGKSNSEQPSGSKDRESEDGVKNDTEDKNEDDKTAESKPSSEPDRAGTGSPDKSRRHDRYRDRDRDPRRERERELERYEREREHDRAKREKDRENRNREDERRYKAREKEWESREKEKEHWRKREREREKDRAYERKWEVVDQERDGDDGYGKKRKCKVSDEERKRRQREKEEDLADRVREEEEIAEAKIRAEEEQKKQLEAEKAGSVPPANGFEKATLPNEINAENQPTDQTFELKPSPETYEGLGKRATVPSFFNEDEDEDAHKEKKMRPLVPIDYSTEEQEAIQSSMSEAPSSNMAAAAEFVKRISTVNPRELDGEKEKSRHSHERSGQRNRDRHEEENNSIREESRRDHFERERSNKTKTPENQKLLDAKQLIDTIPKTKDELFSYEINWAIYDQNVLHERMRPWVSKKITDFLGEEEVTLVDYIVSSTQDHVEAGEMLERLQTILDDEAEMFVLKMWRMLIFEIKKVETGLTPKPRG